MDIKPRILIVDDEQDTRDIFKRHLQSDYYVDAVSSANEALSMLEVNEYHIAMTDLVMPGTDGLELLSSIKKKHPQTAVIVISGKATVNMAVTAIKQGAEDLIEKPVEDLEIINLTINKIMKMYWQAQEIARLRSRLSDSFELSKVIGNSLALQKIIEKVRIIAPLDTTVIITGDTGVGKELIAEMIYRNSKRKEKKFVTLNCGSLPETLLESTLFGHKKGSFTDAVRDKVGYFEEADGGTLFLDEITETSLTFQIKLLRALEKGTIRRVGGDTDIAVNVRVMAASNKNFLKEVEKGNFREDLYYRLNVINIHIPPLRERPEDIPLLAQTFIKEFSKKHNKPVHSISDAAMSVLMTYDWKGNVRELKNCIEHSVILSAHDTILPNDLPANIYSPESRDASSIPVDQRLLHLPFYEAKERFEKVYIESILSRCKGDVSLTAETSKIKRQNLYDKFSKYDINPNNFRE